MADVAKKTHNKSLRKARVRAKIVGSAERPRLTVSISNTHVNAQLIDDSKMHTIASATTVGTDAKGSLSDKAKIVGKDIAKKAKKAKITSVVFDRNGRKYAGRLSTLADAAREEGLEF